MKPQLTLSNPISWRTSFAYRPSRFPVVHQEHRTSFSSFNSAEALRNRRSACIRGFQVHVNEHRLPIFWRLDSIHALTSGPMVWINILEYYKYKYFCRSSRLMGDVRRREVQATTLANWNTWQVIKRELSSHQAVKNKLRSGCSEVTWVKASTGWLWDMTDIGYFWVQWHHFSNRGSRIVVNVLLIKRGFSCISTCMGMLAWSKCSRGKRWWQEWRKRIGFLEWFQVFFSTLSTQNPCQ